MNDRPWLSRYDEGVPQTIDYPDEPFFFFLEESARKYPESPCTIFKGAKITFHEMNDVTTDLQLVLAVSG